MRIQYVRCVCSTTYSCRNGAHVYPSSSIASVLRIRQVNGCDSHASKSQTFSILSSAANAFNKKRISVEQSRVFQHDSATIESCRSSHALEGWLYREKNQLFSRTNSNIFYPQCTDRFPFCIFPDAAGLSRFLHAQSRTDPLSDLRPGHNVTVSHLLPQVRDRNVSIGSGLASRTPPVSETARIATRLTMIRMFGPFFRHRFFRVIPAETYLAEFASDRRHMRRPNDTWIKPPPQYSPIKTNGTHPSIVCSLCMCNITNIEDFSPTLSYQAQPGRFH